MTSLQSNSSHDGKLTYPTSKLLMPINCLCCYWTFLITFLLFSDDAPTSAALSSVKRLLQDGVCQGCLSSSYAIFGHRDLASTECPGDKLYPEIQRLGSGKE